MNWTVLSTLAGSEESLQFLVVHEAGNYDLKMKNQGYVLPALPGIGMVIALLAPVLPGNVEGVIEGMAVETLLSLVPVPPETPCQGTRPLLVKLDRRVLYVQLLEHRRCHAVGVHYGVADGGFASVTAVVCVLAPVDLEEALMVRQY